MESKSNFVLKTILSWLATTAILTVSLGAQARSQGTIHNVTRTHTGGSANDISYMTCCSRDGRFVAFDSDATDIVPGDTNGLTDVFVRDMQTSRVIRVSVSNSGAQGNGASWLSGISSFGRFLVFTSEATNIVGSDLNGPISDVFVADILPFMNGTGGTFATRVTNGNGPAYWAQVSDANGQLNVAFVSDATNEVPGDTNGLPDVFMRQVLPQALIRRVSVRTTGVQRATGCIGELAMSWDGRYLAYTSDSTEVFGSWGNGRYQSYLVDNMDTVFNAGWTPNNRRLSLNSALAPGDSDSWSIRVNDNGHAVFASDSTNLVAGDTNGTADAFFKPYLTPLTRISVGPGGVQTGTSADLGAFLVDLSDGANPVFAFDTDVTGIVSGDTNGFCDTFVGRPSAYSRVVHWDGSQLADGTYFPAISGDGQHVLAFSFDTALPYNASFSDGPFIVDYNRQAGVGARTGNSVAFEFHCADDNGLGYLVAFGLSPLPGTPLPGDTRSFPLSAILGTPLFATSPISGGVGTLVIPVPPGVFGAGLTVWVAGASLTSPAAAMNGVKGITNPVRYVL